MLCDMLVNTKCNCYISVVIEHPPLAQILYNYWIERSSLKLVSPRWQYFHILSVWCKADSLLRDIKEYLLKQVLCKHILKRISGDLISDETPIQNKHVTITKCHISLLVQSSKNRHWITFNRLIKISFFKEIKARLTCKAWYDAWVTFMQNNRFRDIEKKIISIIYLVTKDLLSYERPHSIPHVQRSLYGRPKT